MKISRDLLYNILLIVNNTVLLISNFAKRVDLICFVTQLLKSKRLVKKGITSICIKHETAGKVMLIIDKLKLLK